jgi:hypothetical protein
VQLGTSKGANRNLHHWIKNNPATVVDAHAIPKESEGNDA